MLLLLHLLSEKIKSNQAFYSLHNLLEANLKQKVIDDLLPSE